MEKIWLKNYKPGIAAEIKLDDTTLVDLFNLACEKYASNRAVSCHKVALSFADVKERSLRMAQALADLGVKKGDRVALILPNCLQYPLTVFAVLLLGATVVNINPLYTPSEI
jgi:long-chain acyl-CoA synthetase